MKIKLVVILAFTITSCTFFSRTEEQYAVARVNNVFLYKEDIKKIVAPGTPKADSVLRVQNYINNWAKQQLLVEGALLNLNEEKQASFNKLVAQYKIDLYANAYLQALVKQNLDTLVNVKEARSYYESNKKTFKLNEELVKLRYIYLDKNMIDFEAVKTKFKRFNNDDKQELDSISIQFKSFALNDTVWVRYSQVLNKIPPLLTENKDKLLKKSNFVQLKDSLGVYLMHVNNVLVRNETAPLQYVKSTIDQIVINKRKLELIRELEKEITKDAIKNKEFEIYN